MKNLISLILVYSLLLPTSVSADAFSQAIEEQRENCLKDSSHVWDATTNRCQEKAQAKEMRNEVDECTKLKDQAEVAACHARIAQKNTGVGYGDFGDIKSRKNKAMFIDTANGIMSVVAMVGQKSIKSPCPSKNIFAVTSMVGMLTDILLKKKAKDKINELKGAYSAITSSKAYNAQSEALTYLKHEQDVIAGLASDEAKRNMLMSIGYLSAGIAAAMEVGVVTNPNPKCLAPDTVEKVTAVEDGVVDTTGAPATTFLMTRTVPPTLFKKFFSQGMTSYTVLALSGVSLGYTSYLYNSASDQAKDSKENAARVEAMLKQFQDSYASYCPQGREDLNNPKCYCYTDNGQKNLNRTNSEICKQYWVANDGKLKLDPGSYGGTNPNPVGCMTISGQFDESCKCRMFKDNKGENACAKSSTFSGGIVGTGAAQMPGMTTLMSSLNSLMQGQGLPSNLNMANLSSALNALGKMNKKVLDQANAKLKKEGKPLITLPGENEMNKLAMEISHDKNFANANAGSWRNMLSDQRSNDPKLSELIKEAENKAGIVSSITLDDAKKNVAAKDDKKNPFAFFSEGGSGNGGGQVVDLGNPAEEKKYNFKQNDINTRSDVSIFDILSNRYMQSGLKRLFEN